MSGCKNNGGKRTGAGRKAVLPPPKMPDYEKTWKFIDSCLIKGADGVVIASRLGVSPKTFYRYGELCGKWGKDSALEIVDFGSYKRYKKAIGDFNLIERQYDMAMGIYDEERGRFLVKPNPSLLIWLGKVRLGQSDKVNTTIADPSLVVKPKLKINIVKLSGIISG